MTITPTVITAPTKEPVSLDEVKDQLKLELDETEFDFQLELFIQAAREYYEARTASTVHDTTLESTWDAWPSCSYIELPRATPLISVTSVKYKDDVGTETTWSSSSYIADTDTRPGRVVLATGESWPSVTLYPANGIRIRYRAGIASASPVTEAQALVKYPILLLVGGMFENRESIVLPDRNGVEQIAIEYGVEAFIAQNMAKWVF